MGQTLSLSLKSFLNRFIDSLEELEILGILSGAVDSGMTAGQLDNTIKSSLSSLTVRLAALKEKGLIRQTGKDPDTFMLALPASEQYQSIMAALTAYKSHRVEVIETIFRKPSPAITSFSNAFKIKENKDG